jgi:PAS domain S-box-containing protein
MFNKLLNEQAQKHFGAPDKLPAEWKAFLEEVSNTYNDFEKNDYSSTLAGADALDQLNIKLRNEAAELKQAHNELGRILNSVNYGFFSRDLTTNTYTYLSVGCERIYGYTAQDFYENSRLWYDVIVPEDRGVLENDKDQLNRKEEVYTQYRIIHSNKSIRWIELTIIPFFKNEKLCRVDGVVNDITERKQIENEREAMLKELTKSNADLKQFSYIISHNLRAPLSNIQGILKLFDFPDTDSYNRQMLDMLNVSALQLHDTIKDISQILIIKNTVNPGVTCLELEESFNQVLRVFINVLNQMEAEVHVDFIAPTAKMNKSYLESIFINLVSNAVKYHSPDRKLVIYVSSSVDTMGNVEIMFSDNGSGIDLERHREKVFGLYQRFHDDVEGQGLGLFIMKSQIEASGGSIEIESTLHTGTTFIITLAAAAC